MFGLRERKGERNIAWLSPHRPRPGLEHTTFQCMRTCQPMEPPGQAGTRIHLLVFHVWCEVKFRTLLSLWKLSVDSIPPAPLQAQEPAQEEREDEGEGRPGLQRESQVPGRAGRWPRLPGGAGSGSNQDGPGVQDDWAKEGQSQGCWEVRGWTVRGGHTMPAGR